MHTFYLPPEKWQDPFILEQDEAHHLSRVLRIRPGEEVRLLDGQGRKGVFQVLECSRRQVLLQPQEIDLEQEPASRLHLALSWTKSSRRFWLLEKAVELGAWKIIFWEGRNSQKGMDRADFHNWSKRIRAAAKQCGNPWFPELLFLPGGVRAVADHAREMPERIVLWEQESARTLMDLYREGLSGDRIVVTGPEGGLSAREMQELESAGFIPASLGPRVLRWETAVLCVLSLDMFFRDNTSKTTPEF